MGIVSIVKRRVISRLHPAIKRLLLPAAALLLLVHVLSGSGGRDDLPEGQDTPSVLPGEALDPLAAPRRHHPHDSRPANAFETVLRAAGDSESDNQVPKPVEDFEPPERLPKASHKDPAKLREPHEKKRQTVDVGNKKSEQLNERIKKKEASSTKKVRSAPSKSSGAVNKEKEEEEDDIRNSEWSMKKANIPGHDKVKFMGHAITENTVTLTVMSSADKVFMSLNKREIYRGLEERGMHMVVLHPHTGRVMATRVFDTFFNGTEDEMVEFIDNIQDGRIIVFAIRDEAATGLTWKGRNKLVEYGARFADKLAFRDMWILVTKKGALKLAESYSNVALEDTAYEWGGPLFLRTDFDLDQTSDLCKWETSYEEELRQKFCQRFEGYGPLCQCSVKTLDDIFFKTDKQVSKDLSKSPLYNDLAVAVMSSGRPDYLYKTLKSLREAAGSRADRVVVFIEREHREIATLVKLFSMQLVVTGHREGGNVSVTVRVRDKVQHIFRDLMGASFPKDRVPRGMAEPSYPAPLTCTHLVILDDDVQVSVDFFKYLHSLAPVLDRDSTVVGITAFNYNSYSMVASSLDTFYRTSKIHQIALMIPARTVHDHIVPGWPHLKSRSDWYSGLELAMERNSDLAIIYPEVSRSKHFGYRGHKIRGTLQHSFFADHKIALTTDYTIPKENINRLELNAYDKWQLDTVKNSKITSYSFCKYTYQYGEDPLLVFVKYDGKFEHDQHLVATLKCLGAWHLYGEGEWRHTWHFHYHGHPFTLVAVPASPYSSFVPADYKYTDMTVGGSTERPFGIDELQQ